MAERKGNLKSVEARPVIDPNAVLEARRTQISTILFPGTLAKTLSLDWQTGIVSDLGHGEAATFLQDGVRPWECTSVGVTAELRTIRTNAQDDPIGVLVASYNTVSEQVAIQEFDNEGLRGQFEIKQLPDERYGHDKNYQLTLTLRNKKSGKAPNTLQEIATEYDPNFR